MRLDTPINLDVGQFFRWWTSELAACVPARLKKALGQSIDYLVLSRDGNGLAVVYRGAEEAERPLGHFSLDEAGRQKREDLFRETPELAEATVLLRLNGGQALRKTLKLPLAAEENLTQVLAFEMDRLTPFKSDQVYYGARVAGRSPATRQITVDMALTPRAKLDTLLEELAVAGWQPEIVDVAGDGALGAFNLLPEKFRPERSRWPRLANTALATLIVVLFAALLVLPVWSARSTADTLEEEVRKAGKVAKQVEELREQVEKLEHETRFLENKKRTEPSVLGMLDELTRIMPDNTWLNGLQYKDRKIVVQGQSPSASSLIELIDKSDHFQNTSFVSPVTKDTGSGLERFQIASEVIHGKPSAEPEADSE
jgi:general secretion pathway protein L